MSRKTGFSVLFSICLFLSTMFWTGFIGLVASHPAMMMQEVNPQRITLESLPPEYTQFTAQWRETFNEVRLTEVSPNKVAMWWIYNDGFLIKTPKYVIAIDLYLPWVTNLSADDLDIIDILVITHPHGDHYDPKVAQNIKNGGGCTRRPSGRFTKTAVW